MVWGSLVEMVVVVVAVEGLWLRSGFGVGMHVLRLKSTESLGIKTTTPGIHSEILCTKPATKKKTPIYHRSVVKTFTA